MPTHAVGCVALEPVPSDRRRVLDALMQLYLHDFSEHAPLGTPYGEVDEEGRFTHPALDKPLDHAVAEFFTLRKYRLAHVGTCAAQLLFDRLPGHWEVPVAAYNQGAILFWRAVTSKMRVRVEEHDGDGQRWRGPVLCFATEVP